MKNSFRPHRKSIIIIITSGNVVFFGEVRGEIRQQIRSRRSLSSRRIVRRENFLFDRRFHRGRNVFVFLDRRFHRGRSVFAFLDLIVCGAEAPQTARLKPVLTPWRQSRLEFRPRPEAFRYAPCQTGSSGSNFRAFRQGSRTKRVHHNSACP